MVVHSGTLGITANTASRMIFGAGALYRNYGTVGQTLIGATRGGATLTLNRTDRDVEVDGVGARPVEGLVRTLGTTVTLEITLPELSDQTWKDITRGSKSTTDTKTQISPPSESRIPTSQYYNNIALVAEEYSTGTEKAILLKNALVFGDWTFTSENLGEAGVKLTFRAHYKNSALNDPPYTIGVLANLTRDWDPSQDGSGQSLTERIYSKDGTLGSSTGADANDPSWSTSPPSLTFAEDDYIKIASDIWTTT